MENHVEELVAEWYKLKGYIVMRNLWYRVPRGEHRSHPGHTDLDVLAVNENEVVMVSCATQGHTWGTAKENAEGIVQHFAEIYPLLLRDYPLLKEYSKKDVRRVYVSESHSKTMTRILRFSGVEVLKLEDVVDEILHLINDKRTKGRIENPILRTLLFLDEYEFIVDDKNE